MQGITYAYLGPEDAAGKFAKKGTATDITLFNAKKGDQHLNLVTATRYPEKLSSLLITLDLSDEVVLHPAQLDRSLGEQIVAAELFGRTKGFARASAQVPAEQLRQILSKTSLKDLEVTEDSDALLRDKLYERVAASTEGDLVLPVDHSFPVKGVGTVILGLVRGGVVNAHQTLQIYPTDRTLEVRSIQVHDVDVKSAPTRSRVGLAVKNVEAPDVSRGTVLAPPGSLKVLTPEMPVKLKIALHPFNKWAPRAGAVLHLFHLLQDAVFRVDAAEGATKESVTLAGKFEQPLAYHPNYPMVLVDLDNKVQRFIGRATVHG